MERSCLAVVLAAGDGTRMRSQTPKVLHRVAGLPMVGHVVWAAGEAGVTALAVVVGNQAEQVSKVLDSMGVSTQTFEQAERLGTGHAVLAARAAIEQGADDLLILFGDTPLVRPQVLIDARAKLASGADVVVVGFVTDDPSGYGRVLMDGGKVTAIREHKDATEAERKVQFCNGGLMAIRGDRALGWLDAISNDNAKGEFYLTDIVEIARSAGGTVDAVEAGEEDVLGVNNKLELARAEAIWQRRKRADMMLEGVSMIAPETVFFSHDTQIGAETTIEPNVVFGEGVRIANGVTIHAFCHIAGTQAEEGVVIGPFARLRPGARLGNGSKVGNFCEVKNAELGRDAKINHLTYIGDAEIGAGSNIGAGTITCNYDGFSKFRTRIGEGAFIGSNSSLVAPVSIGDGSYVASGSVITEDVADDALAFGRARQSNKDGMGKALKERLKSEKEKTRKG